MKSLKQRVREQIREALSDKKRWKRLENKLGRKPTRNEILADYVQDGSARRYAERNDGHA